MSPLLVANCMYAFASPLTSPDFRHKITKDVLWIRSCYSPSRVQEEPRESGLQSEEDAIGSVVALLKACAKRKDLLKGSRLHDDILNRGLLENNVYVGSALVNMYAKCGALAKAQEVFNELPIKNVVSWNGLISGYAQHGHGKEAVNCFERMQLEGLSPNAVTFACLLKACGNIGALDKGQQMHTEIIRQGLLQENIVVGNALVDMYAKCGALAKAQEVFYELPVRDAVSWNVLIAGFAHHEHGEEAISCFEQMRCEGHSPDPITFACTLKACGSIGASDKGQEIHSEIVRYGCLEKNVKVGTALVDMYAKCGALAKAQEVFDELSVRNAVSWTALIAGYAQIGKDAIAFNSFKEMIEEGKVPDLVTFTILLNSCSHSGLLEKAQMYFETMSAGYGISPNLEHYACMIDLFGRAGHLDKAMTLIKEMPFSANLMVWHSLLNSCRKWGNVKLARLAFEHAVQLAEEDAAAYVCMSNVYVAAGMQEDADKIEAMRVKKQAWKRKSG